MQLGFRRIGPPRPAAVSVPPAGEGWHSHYVLAFDESRGTVIYAHEPDHHEFGPSWELKDGAWKPLCTERIRVESPSQDYVGWWDPTRDAVVAWNFYDRSSGSAKPVGVILDPVSPRILETTGDQPAIGKLRFQDQLGAFGFDRERGVTVCATRRGIWELDDKNVWRRVWRGVIAEWGDDGVSVAWDAPRGRVIFQVDDDGDDDVLKMFAWDGRRVVDVPTDGLPEDDYEVSFSDLHPVLGSHPELGAVMVIGGDAGVWALAYHGRSWRRVGNGDGPPRGGSHQLAYDPSHDGFIMGPGSYEPEPGEYPTDQQLFFVEGPLGWTRQGAVEIKSPLDDLWSQKRVVASQGRWIATGSRTLRTFAWSDAGWQEKIDKEAGDEVWEVAGGVNLELTAAGDRIIAVGVDGSVHELEERGGTTWRTTHVGQREIGADRNDALVVWDADRQRLVLWGGQVKDRFSNRVWIFEKGAWRAARRPSPRPRELAAENYPDYALIYDTRLDRVVRFGETACAVLEDDVWVEVVPDGYVPKISDAEAEQAEAAALGALGGDDDEADLDLGDDEDRDDESEDEESAGDVYDHEKYPGSPRWCAHAHDPATGITLVIAWSSKKIFRVDLQRCEEVGSIELPDDLRVPKHDNAAGIFRDACAFDAASRQLLVQNLEDAHGHYALDLGPLFDRCADERQAPWETGAVVPEPWLCLYRASDRQRWRGRIVDTMLEIGEGGLRDSAIETTPFFDRGTAEAAFAEQLVTARGAGFVPVLDLDRVAVEALVGVGSRPFRIAAEPTEGTPPPARFGGGPGGVDPAGWPIYHRELYQSVVYMLPEIYPWAAAPQSARDELVATAAEEIGVAPNPKPMGFLFQVPVSSLTKHAGIAVYCAVDGSSGEHEAFNEARLIDTQHLISPPSPSPAGVPALPMFAIELGPKSSEIDRELIQVLGDVDPGLVDRIETLWGTGEDEEDEEEEEQDEDDDDSESERWHGKIGGEPDWVQSPVAYQSRDGRPYRFVLQIDIDDLSDRVKAWKHAGLSGVLYVFVHPDEVCAAAFWQYT
jgi:hypothetical protein